MSDHRQRDHFRIAVIPGDGIGKEVVPQGCAVLEAAAKKHGFDLRLDTFDFASHDYYARHGTMLPDDWKSQIGSHDAIFFGAVGWGPRRSPITCRYGARCCSSGASSISTSTFVRSA